MHNLVLMQRGPTFLGVLAALLSAAALVEAQIAQHVENVQHVRSVSGVICDTTLTHCLSCFSVDVCAECDSGYEVVAGACEESTSSSSSGLSTAAKVVIEVAVSLLVLTCFLSTCCCCYRKRMKSELTFTESRLQTVNPDAGTLVFLKRPGQMSFADSAPSWSDFGFLFFQAASVRLVRSRGSAGVGEDLTDENIPYQELRVADVLKQDSTVDPEKLFINGTVVTSDARRIAKIKSMLHEYKEASTASLSPSPYVEKDFIPTAQVVPDNERYEAFGSALETTRRKQPHWI